LLIIGWEGGVRPILGHWIPVIPAEMTVW